MNIEEILFQEFYAEALEEKMCEDTLNTIRECKVRIEHLIQSDMIKETEVFTDLLTELTRIPLTKNHPLNKYK